MMLKAEPKIPVCGRCSGPLILESDINGNDNVWFVCKSCNLSFLVFMNPGFSISKLEGFVTPPGYSEDNPLCGCGHTSSQHSHPNESTTCVLCDCESFVCI